MQEETRRKKIFEENVDFINKPNQKYLARQKSFYLDINTFADLVILEIDRLKTKVCFSQIVRDLEPEDHWSCIAHLSAEDMLKSAVIEEKKFKYSHKSLM